MITLSNGIDSLGQGGVPATGHGGGDGSGHLLAHSPLGHQLLPLLILQLHQLDEGMPHSGICVWQRRCLCAAAPYACGLWQTMSLSANCYKGRITLGLLIVKIEVACPRSICNLLL